MRLRFKIREHRRTLEDKDPLAETTRRQADEELAAIAKSRPSMKAAEQQRDAVMKVLDLKSRPTYVLTSY